MINKTMQDALNEQINAELYSAYLYLSMSAYFEDAGLAGFANWMRIQFEEEQAHAMKFFDYLTERGGRVILTPIEGVETEFTGTISVFEEVLKHERLVTSKINSLMDLAIDERDHASKSFLQWFIDEQVEEESTVEEILSNLKIINAEGQGLLMMNKDFAARTFTPLA